MGADEGRRSQVASLSYLAPARPATPPWTHRSACASRRAATGSPTPPWDRPAHIDRLYWLSKKRVTKMRSQRAQRRVVVAAGEGVRRRGTASCAGPAPSRSRAEEEEVVQLVGAEHVFRASGRCRRPRRAAAAPGRPACRGSACSTARSASRRLVRPPPSPPAGARASWARRSSRGTSRSGRRRRSSSPGPARRGRRCRRSSAPSLLARSIRICVRSRACMFSKTMLAVSSAARPMSLHVLGAGRPDVDLAQR